MNRFESIYIFEIMNDIYWYSYLLVSNVYFKIDWDVALWLYRYRDLLFSLNSYKIVLKLNPNNIEYLNKLYVGYY